MEHVIYIPLPDMTKGGYAYIPVLDRLNISHSFKLEESTAVLPLTDKSTYILADHQRFMPKSSLDVILNRDLLFKTGIPTIPTRLLTVDEQASEGYLKKPRNSAIGGEYVIMPDLGLGIQDLDISFSVNSNGEIYPFLELNITYGGYKQPMAIEMSKEDNSVTLDFLQSAVTSLSIRGGIHNAQFLKYNNVWSLVDWNPRPIYFLTEHVGDTYSLLEEPLLFMLDQPIPKTKWYYRSKGFYTVPIPANKASDIKDLGLIPRRGGGATMFNRVNGISRTQEALDYKFQQLENILAS